MDKDLISSVFGYAAGFFAVLAYIPYVLAIIRKKMVPSRSGWGLWMVAALLLFLTYWKVGATATLWMSGTYFIGSLTVFILSFPYGKGEWTTEETIYAFACAISIVLWCVYSAFVGLLATLAIDTMGAYPLLKKVKGEQSSESTLEEGQLPEEPLGWTLFFIGAVCNLISALTSDLQQAENPVGIVIYPAAICIVVSTIFYYVVVKKKPKNNHRLE